LPKHIDDRDPTFPLLQGSHDLSLSKSRLPHTPSFGCRESLTYDVADGGKLTVGLQNDFMAVDKNTPADHRTFPNDCFAGVPRSPPKVSSSPPEHGALGKRGWKSYRCS